MGKTILQTNQYGCKPLHNQYRTKVIDIGMRRACHNQIAQSIKVAVGVVAIHMVVQFHTFTGSIGLIDIEAMESAARVTTWHLTEARRFLSELAMPAELANPARLESWLLDYCRQENTDSVPTREVQRHGPGGLRDKTIINDAINELAELGRAPRERSSPWVSCGFL